jgi:hypothetical protein
MDKIQVLIKVEEDDFNVTTRVICASHNIDKLEERFREEVQKEKQFESENEIEYDTVEETHNSFEAYNEGRHAESSISIYITDSEVI